MSVAGISAPSASLPIQVAQLFFKSKVVQKFKNNQPILVFAAPRPANKDSNANGNCLSYLMEYIKQYVCSYIRQKIRNAYFSSNDLLVYFVSLHPSLLVALVEDNSTLFFHSLKHLR